MFRADDILRRLEPRPHLFSLLHRYGKGADTNRRVFVNTVRPGAVVIEIGANKGSYTALFSRLVGKTGRVYAFEPVKQSFDQLAARLNTLGAANVSAFKMAVSDRSSREAEIIIPGGDSQQAALVAHHTGSWSSGGDKRSERVEITSLDEFVELQRIRRVDFVKLDVEGAELSVLHGARNCFALNPILHLEINSDWLDDFGTTPGEILQVLKSYGYERIYKIDSAELRGFCAATETDRACLQDGRTSGDFLFSTHPI
jgi:FkbM family methyltransferase